MLKTLAVANYRSINKLVVPLDRLNLITGANGSGKSNLYRALRLLAETAQGGVINALAREGGLDSTFWAGPENVSRRMLNGEIPVQGSVAQGAKRLRLGFAGEDFSYAISLGLPVPSSSYFSLDPEIKKECIWAGHVYRPASLLVQRSGAMVRARDGQAWDVLAQHTPNYHSLFDQVGSLRGSPEVLMLRESIRGWRFFARTFEKIVQIVAITRARFVLECDVNHAVFAIGQLEFDRKTLEGFGSGAENNLCHFVLSYRYKKTHPAYGQVGVKKPPLIAQKGLLVERVSTK